MEQVLPGVDPNDPDSDPITESNDLKDAGDTRVAYKILWNSARLTSGAWMRMPTWAISCSTGRQKPFAITTPGCGLANCHWVKGSRDSSPGVTSTTDRFSVACTGTACAAGVFVGSRRPNVCSIECCGSTRATIKAYGV